MIDWLLATLQRLLPQHAISRLVGRVAASEWPPLKNLLIRAVVRLYRVQLHEARHQHPSDYPSFSAFFTRELAPDARTVDGHPASIVSPVDGTVSQCGRVSAGRIVQAKGHRFSVPDLLGRPDHGFDDGHFVTIYLSPRDYHRVHVPVAARLQRVTYIPGRLFSVGDATTRVVDGIYARNERVVFDLTSEQTGPLALVMVGALNVGSIATVNEGVVAPGPAPRHWLYEPGIPFEKGAELARFNLGSTVILLFPPGGIGLRASLSNNDTVRLGEMIATHNESR